MSTKPKLFEVWMSRGEGLKNGPRFGKLVDALNYVGAHLDEASFAIRLPEGGWFRNIDDRIIFPRVA